MVFVNDFLQGGHVERFRFLELYRYYLIGYPWNLSSDYIFNVCFIFFLQVAIFHIIIIIYSLLN